MRRWEGTASQPLIQICPDALDSLASPVFMCLLCSLPPKALFQRPLCVADSRHHKTGWRLGDVEWVWLLLSPLWKGTTVSHPSLWQSTVCTYIHPAIHLSVHPSIYLSICLYEFFTCNKFFFPTPLTSSSPANGGRSCSGPSYQFQMCNTHECKDPYHDYRAEQCSMMDNKFEYQNTWHHWLPYEHPDRK